MDKQKFIKLYIELKKDLNKSNLSSKYIFVKYILPFAIDFNETAFKLILLELKKGKYDLNEIFNYNNLENIKVYQTPSLEFIDYIDKNIITLGSVSKFIFKIFVFDDYDVIKYILDLESYNISLPNFVDFINTKENRDDYIELLKEKLKENINHPMFEDIFKKLLVKFNMFNWSDDVISNIINGIFN